MGDKLTKAQVECLRESARETGCQANDSYQPTLKLTKLGLVTRSSMGFGTFRHHATEAGRAALSAIEGKKS